MEGSSALPPLPPSAEPPPLPPLPSDDLDPMPPPPPPPPPGLLLHTLSMSASSPPMEHKKLSPSPSSILLSGQLGQR